MKLIVGIGNPGKEYEKTRHNIGYMTVDAIADHYGVKFDQKKFNSIYGILRLNNEKIIIMKPETYVNLSGVAVLSIKNYYGIDQKDILVIYDDIALPLGKIRVRFKGSGGGHNGLDNIIEYLKTNEIKRMRIGIDNNPLIDKKDYVLGKFTKKDKKVLKETLERLKDVPYDFINKRFSDFMNKYNREFISNE